MILLKNIYLSINGISIFEDLSLSVPLNSKVVISGSSGIGKSTLLNLILGFLRPDSGTIKVNNHQLTISSIKSIRKVIAWLPQNVNILGKGRVDYMINDIFNYQVNRKKKQSYENIQYYLNELNLDSDILIKDFESLSGGEKQRIGLMICLLLKRPVLLLDEPTSALDEISKQKVINLIFKDSDLTVLACSHDNEWLSFSDIIYKIENKKAIPSVV